MSEQAVEARRGWASVHEYAPRIDHVLGRAAGHMTASDFCAARYIFSCQAGAIHT